jgi:hypothetical protein
MIYVVEVALNSADMAQQFSQMRTWLDHMKFHTVGFRQISRANTCRIDFEHEGEAAEFARAFAGQVLNRSAV